MTEAVDHQIAQGREITTVVFPTGTPPEQIDVLIVGAGPAGLAAALELSARGVQVAVVDAAEQALLGRAGAIGHSPRAVEHFRRWGVLQRIRENWGFPPEWNRGLRTITSLIGHELVPHRRPGFTERGNSAFSLHPQIRRSQSLLQQVFLDELGKRGVSVTGGWRLDALAQDAEGASSEVTDVRSGETRRIRSRYVVGADGSQSAVRKLSGIERSGPYGAEKYYRLVVRTPDISDVVGAAPSGTNYVYNQRSSGHITSISATTWRITTEPYPLDAEPTEQELLDNARAKFGWDVELELVSGTSFYHGTRIADTFRKGRALLVGDAAHVRTPGGNLGEGFGDVANLGWKLAAVLQGQGGEALLDSYDQERRRHNWRIANTAFARAERGKALLAEVREIGVPDDEDLSADAVARRERIGALLADRRSGGVGTTFDERYDASSTVWYEPGQIAEEPAWAPDRYTPEGRPGHRAPDGYVDPFGDTLYDRIGLTLSLIVFGEDRTVESSFVAEARERGLTLSVIHLDHPEAAALYGAGNALVRPDQHVVWRGERLPEGGAAVVLDHVLGVATVDEVRAQGAHDDVADREAPAREQFPA